MSIIRFLLTFLIIFFGISTSFASDVQEEDSQVQQFVFELDEAAEAIEPEISAVEEKPFLSGYIEQHQIPVADEILLDTDFNPTYRVNQIKKVSTYSKSLDTPKGYDELAGKGALSIVSKSYSYNDTTTLVKNVRQEIGATVKKDRFSLSSGLETTYDTTNINGASRGVFITPKVQLSDRAAISIKNKISGQDLNKYEPTVGIDYTPKYLKNSSIWMGAGATIRDNNIQSQSLNLKTDFYIF